jgi:DNA-binding IclR family transcriptional regulator
LAELSRHTDISKATCAAIVLELTNAGYLTRAADKRYGLGPAAMALGRAASEGSAALTIAREEMIELHRRHRLLYTASAVIEDEIVVLEAVGRLPGIGALIHVGQRYPFRPPSGVALVLWEPDAIIEEWAGRDPVAPSTRRLDDILRAARDARAAGFHVQPVSDVALRLYALLAMAPTAHASAQVVSILRDVTLAGARSLPPGEEQAEPAGNHVHFVSSPVFGPSGRAVLVIATYVGDALAATGLGSLCEELRDVAAKVTADIGGFDPWRSS